MDLQITELTNREDLFSKIQEKILLYAVGSQSNSTTHQLSSETKATIVHNFCQDLVQIDIDLSKVCGQTDRVLIALICYVAVSYSLLNVTQPANLTW